MNINITVLAGLKLVPGHEELPVKLFVQFIEDQAPLGSHKRAVCIRVALVADIADRLALGIYVVHHMDEIQLVIAVIPVALGHGRVHALQRALHDVVHLLDLNLFFSQRSRVLFRKTADKIFLLLRKCIKDTRRRLIHRGNDLLRIKFFSCSVFLNYIDHTCFLLILRYGETYATPFSPSKTPHIWCCRTEYSTISCKRKEGISFFLPYPAYQAEKQEEICQISSSASSRTP